MYTDDDAPTVRHAEALNRARGRGRAEVLDAIRVLASARISLAESDAGRLAMGHVRAGPGGWWIRRPKPAAY